MPPRHWTRPRSPAPAITGYLTVATGLSIKRITREFDTVQNATIELNRQQLTIHADPTPTNTEILTALGDH